MHSQNHHSVLNDLIGFAMKVYRKSPLHSERFGKLFAKLLSLLILFRKNKKVTKEIDGIRYELDLNEVIDSSLYFSSTFEKPEEEIIRTLLKPGMNVIDIGANIGYYTFRMASFVQPNGKVYAFEPTQWAYEKLVRNASINPSLQNVKIIKVGLSDKDLPDQRLSFQSSYRIDGKQTNILENIRLEKLDSFITKEKIRRIDFIKIDVDGFESKVIRGAKNTLERFHPVILIEISPLLMIKFSETADELIQYLVEQKYLFETNRREPINDLCDFCHRIMKDSPVMILAK